MAKKSALGRGLSSLMPESVEQAQAQGDRVLEVKIQNLQANPDQPRKEFAQEQLQELAASIAEKGIIQPLVVEETSPDLYTIIAGERRFRASKIAGLTTLPVVVKTFSEADKLEIGLIENIQREDLNAIEEAMGYHNLMERFGHTQDEVAKKLGKSRSAVANALRLLRLPEDIQNAISARTLSAGHARALLSISSEYSSEVSGLFSLITDEELSVRFAEKAARLINDGKTVEEIRSELKNPPVEETHDDEVLRQELLDLASGARVQSNGESSNGTTLRPAEIWNMEEALIRALGTRVSIKGSLEKGRIEIQYYSAEDLNRLHDLLLDD